VVPPIGERRAEGRRVTEDDDRRAYDDGVDAAPADMVAEGEGWGVRLGREEATGASVLVDLAGATDRVTLVVETETSSAEGSAGGHLDPDEAEALAATLRDAAEAVRER